MTKNIMELWLRLLNDAVRGTADAQEAVRLLGEVPTTPDNLARWMSRFMPLATAGSSKSEAIEDWLEDTWRMMGVVPRYRYLELLERHELLRRRLEQAEKRIETLRKTMRPGKVPEQEAQQVLDLWEDMLQETLKIQANWMRTWTAGGDEAKEKEAEDMDQPDEKDS